MACYLASDIHLRMDRPERARRFARWVRQLEDDASLLVAGDLCDFWMVARQREKELMESEGLGALADFRARGGSLAILPGNHDLWICPFYERTLGATLLREPYDTTIPGCRLHVVHGHLLGARRKWKGCQVLGLNKRYRGSGVAMITRTRRKREGGLGPSWGCQGFSSCSGQPTPGHSHPCL